MAKRLVRKNAIIAGVAGGIGSYLDIDPTVVRLAFVILTILGGSSCLIYLICWIMIPKK